MYGRRRLRYQPMRYAAAASVAAVTMPSTIQRRAGLHSNGLAQGTKGLEAADAGLTPWAFAAAARQV